MSVERSAMSSRMSPVQLEKASMPPHNTRRVMAGVITRSSAPSHGRGDRLARIEDLLVQWGEFVVSYRADGRLWSAPTAAAFEPARSGYVEASDFLDGAARDTMLAVDAAIDELRGGVLEHWIVLHWHYTYHAWEGAPAAVWRHRRLPEFGSANYESLLDAARGALIARLLARGDWHLLDV